MNILTFDIEDWYNCDFITPDFNWNKYEVRIYNGVEKILNELEQKKQKGTFFCLGWIAEKHPDIIRQIFSLGHHIGCHSYQHQLATKFDRISFKKDTEKAQKLIEDVIGSKVNAYRAPGFSITERNLWTIEVLSELGFEYDSSIFPAIHDYGGCPSIGIREPAIFVLKNGTTIKEFPINTQNILGRNIVFSGGGFFRLFPYCLVKKWTNDSNYVMTYFHPRDFDPDQPVIKSLPAIRKFKSYVGLSNAFNKFDHYLSDFSMVNIEQANNIINWYNVKKIVI